MTDATVAYQHLGPALASKRLAGRLTRSAGLAKLSNTRKARPVISLACDRLGGNGVLFEHHVMPCMEEIGMIHRFEGTGTTPTLIVGRDAAGIGPLR